MQPKKMQICEDDQSSTSFIKESAPMHFEIDDEGNVDLALPPLAKSDSSSSYEDDDELLAPRDEHQHEPGTDREHHGIAIETSGAADTASSHKSHSHSFKDWLNDIFISLVCSDSICTTQNPFAFCAPTCSNGCRFDSHVITSINESRAHSGQLKGYTYVPKKLTEAYTQGIYYFIPNNNKFKPSSATLNGQLLSQTEEFVFISKEEEYFVSRWNGHLPLVPMSASKDAVQRKSRLKKKALVNRGQTTLSTVSSMDGP